MLQPLRDRVVIKPLKDAEKSGGGISLPDVAIKENYQLGIILAVGPGDWYQGEYTPMGVEMDDVVMFSRHSGTKIVHEGTELLVMGVKDLFTIVTI